MSHEHRLVGAVLADPKLYPELGLNPEQFVFTDVSDIWSAIGRMQREARAVDCITLAEWLEEHNPRPEGWASAVFNIEPVRATVDVAKGYAEIVIKKYREREALAVADQLIANPGDVDFAITRLMELVKTDRKWEHDTLGVIDAGLLRIEHAKTGDVGVKSGVDKLDNRLGGFQSKDLIVIGARPSVGKTAVMCNFVLHANCPVGIISAEQGVDQIGIRLLSILGRLDAAELRIGRVADETRLNNTVSDLAKHEIYLFDKPAPRLNEVLGVARQWKHRHNIQALYVDYLQYIQNPGDHPRAERVGEISNALKALARELDIPVIALAQVNREVERRSPPIPQMGDLKDSGTIEQDADVIVLLYRNEDEPGVLELIVDKNRHGPTGVTRVAWWPNSMRIDNLDERYA